MLNNASSAVDDDRLARINNSAEENVDTNELTTKLHGLKNAYVGKVESVTENSDIETLSENNVEDDEEEMPTSSNFPNEQNTMVMSSTFTMNQELTRTFTKSNFPPRFPMKEPEVPESSVLLDDIKTWDLVPMRKSRMTKTFIKFWNRIITKQDPSTKSVLDHQLTDKEAGYIPCRMDSLFENPEYCLMKDYCKKIKYTGPGNELLSSPNQFCKVSVRSAFREQVSLITEFFSNPTKQFLHVPIEFTSNLSRNMMKSYEISQHSQSCNKFRFYCDIRNFEDQVIHPLFTIEYKNSIEEEMLPCSSLCLVDNYRLGQYVQVRDVYKALVNCPYLSHFLQRQDFSIDNFFVRSFHYTRYYCENLKLGSKTNANLTLTMKDSILNYLLACTAKMCFYIKYWVLNPEQATYFRCWCGQKIHDAKEEEQILKKIPIGSADLFNYQKAIQENPQFHERHVEQKQLHTCACSKQFNDHQSWYSHVLSKKIWDISKFCPITLYNISNSCQKNKKFVCECSYTFSDYNFWNFWIHICSCKTFRAVIKNQCHCSERYQEPEFEPVETEKTKKVPIVRKRKRSSRPGKRSLRRRKPSNVAENENDDTLWRFPDDTNLPAQASSNQSETLSSTQ